MLKRQLPSVECKYEERCAVLGGARACIGWVSHDICASFPRGERAQPSMGMLDPIHKPKLPIAKAALVGGAGT